MAEQAMPAFTKSPPELVKRFTTVLERFPDAEPRKMFGFPAAFVAGNMATGLFRDRWLVRLPASEVERAIAAGAEAFEPMPGKPMKGFVAVPRQDVDDDTRIATWVERGVATARALPPKK